MDFELSEEQQALEGLAKKMFRELCPPEALDKLEKNATPNRPLIHEPLWQALAGSELLGLGLSEDVGGAGSGLFELCLLIEQAGWVSAPVPLIPTLISAALPLDHFGSQGQREALLPGVIAGEAFLSAALSDTGEAPVEAAAGGDAYSLTGVRDVVPLAQIAARVLVPAMVAGRLAWFLVDPSSEGVSVESQTGTNEELFGRITFSGAAGELLGTIDQGEEIKGFAVERTRLAQCALAAGLSGKALRLTAQYATEREQFGRPIGTFQAVGQRAADAYIDVETMKISCSRAAWMLDDGQDAEREVAVAGYWSAEGAHRVVSAALHIHGGMGFDRDYPLYRYFLQVKQLEFTLGSASGHLARLGQMLAHPGSETTPA